jgi:Tannase and feruloyl esterase
MLYLYSSSPAMKSVPGNRRALRGLAGELRTSVQDNAASRPPKKMSIDFAYRAVHEMTVKAKLIIAAYYGREPKLSYWYGCSTGGRQALAEAQRFPADYNGIVAGAPALFLTHMQAASIWKAQAIRRLVLPSKLLLLHNAVLTACDARDGVKDGLLDDPRLCDFDPKILECKGDDRPDCLTAAQITVVRAFYSPTVNPRTKAPFISRRRLRLRCGRFRKCGPFRGAASKVIGISPGPDFFPPSRSLGDTTSH